MSVLLGIDMDFANPCKQWGGSSPSPLLMLSQCLAMAFNEISAYFSYIQSGLLMAGGVIGIPLAELTLVTGPIQYGLSSYAFGQVGAWNL